ncbi:helix-turn-helix domain-containing protein [Thermodesulfobacteriota bacterium]
MNNAELIALVNRLRREPAETEWLEFKRNRYESQAIGEYLSALANSACLVGKPKGYLVFGIDDGHPSGCAALNIQKLFLGGSHGKP